MLTRAKSQQVAMVGCEALSRWHTASGELCGPGAFIASIENDFDLAVDLTSQVLHSVNRELRPFLVATRQFYAVLGEHRHVPHRIVDAETDEPAEQQIVVQLLHQLPLRADVKNACNNSARSSCSGGIDGQPIGA